MDKIGAYKILETLHKGPRPLYRAEAADGSPVALKAAAVEGLKPEDRERFLREGETCRLLEHPNVIRVYDVGEAGGMLYQAMELLEGLDLEKTFASGRKFTWDEKFSIMEQVCAGLAYAHGRSLVHRDVKPANLFLQNSGQVKVLDFGMVRVANSNLTRAGSALGTLNYMAPEQIQGNPCIAASDVFSVGIVFYQMATGVHPFATRNQNLSQLVSAIVFSPTPPLRDLCPDAPEGLDKILEKALQKKAELRYQNAHELQQAVALCRALAAQAPRGGAASSSEAASSTPSAAAKTRLIARPVPAGPTAPAAQSTPRAKPGAQQGVQGRYCPICTQSVPAAAEICPHCGNRLSAAGAPAEQKSSKSPALYIAIGIIVLLVIAVVMLLLRK